MFMSAESVDVPHFAVAVRRKMSPIHDVGAKSVEKLFVLVYLILLLFYLHVYFIG